ncbi:MAG TPA: hypothetical protein VFC19_01165 [Candidatus Limnocylindrales bacterium]|nr:hypothetical protein [Candidatus Limnocylindrales bacterium]
MTKRRRGRKRQRLDRLEQAAKATGLIRQILQDGVLAVGAVALVLTAAVDLVNKIVDLLMR